MKTLPDTTRFKIQLSDAEYLGAKHFHQWQCMMCNCVFTGTLVARKQALKLHDSQGCPSCARLRGGKKRSVQVYDTHVILPLKSLIRQDRKNQVTTIQHYRDAGKLVFFGDEVQDHQELIEQKIQHINGASRAVKLHARKLQLVGKSHFDTMTPVREFFDQHHIQESVGNMSYVYALLLGARIVACMTFSKPRQGLGNVNQYGDNTYELVRYATDASYRVVGGASRLLKAFVRDMCPSMIFSFADKRWSKGNMYTQLGFELESTSSPDYYYVDQSNPTKRSHRWGFRKSALAKKWPDTYNSELTEYQNAEAHGYFRVWGLGQLKYSKRWPC